METISKTDYYCTAAMDDWGANGLLSLSRCLVLDHDQIYLNDLHNQRMFVVDKDLHYINQFGGMGQGPGEMIYTNYFYVYEDKVYVHDSGARKILVFSRDGQFQESFPLNLDAGMSRFTIADNTLFISTPWEETPIKGFDLMGEHRLSFGNLRKKPTPTEQWAANTAHLAKIMQAGEPRMVAVLAGEPFIDLYTFEEQFITTYDLSHIDHIRRRIIHRKEALQQDPQKKASMFGFFGDIYVHENTLYVLVIGESGTGFDTILRLELTGNEAYVTQEISLVCDQPNFYALGFCVGANERLTVFEGISRQLVVFTPDGS